MAAPIAGEAAGSPAALSVRTAGPVPKEVQVTMKMAALLAITLFMLGVANQTAPAAERQSEDPTSAVAVFDWSHRMDANGYKGR